jgi:hypothetical protein
VTVAAALLVVAVMAGTEAHIWMKSVIQRPAEPVAVHLMAYAISALVLKYTVQINYWFGQHP